MNYIEEADLQKWIKTDDRHNLWLAVHEIARQTINTYHPSHPDREDMIQEATIYVMRRIRDYDPARAKAFVWITQWARFRASHHLTSIRRRRRFEGEFLFPEDW